MSVKYSLKAVIITSLLMLAVSATCLFAPPAGAAGGRNLPEGRFSLRALSDEMASIVEKVSPSVVSIRSVSVIKQRRANPSLDPFYFFFGPPAEEGGQPEQRISGSGSGVIVSADGYILTNTHVVGEAKEIEVELADDRKLPARLIGADKPTDIAVIKVDAEKLPAARLGSSTGLRVGEWVLAIGNPFGLSQTVTSGIVSYNGRHNLGISSYENFIQTDAAINPGNSGGPLVNLDGEVVGINSAIVTGGGVAANAGIGLAVPIDMARGVMEQLIASGKVSRGYLGVGIQDLTPELAKAVGADVAKGILVTQVFPDTAASKAGVKEGDVIVKWNGNPVNDTNELRNKVAAVAPGSAATLGIIRDGQAMSLKINVQELAAAGGDGQESRTRTGFTVQDLDTRLAQELGLPRDSKGVVIVEVEPDSKAAEMGLRPGMMIESVNRVPVEDTAAFHKAINDAGDRALLLVRQGSVKMFILLPVAR